MRGKVKKQAVDAFLHFYGKYKNLPKKTMKKYKRS